MSGAGAVTHTLQADFSGTAFGGSPTWTDITAYWMSSGIDPGGQPATEPWGRQDQSSTVESSTTSFVLNNADGRFTPGKASSPYYPNVKRRVRMRHTITDGTTVLTLEDGYVDSWTVTVQTTGPTLATASLTDAFGRLSVSTTLRPMAVEEMLRDAPTALFLLDEASGSSTAGDISSALPGAKVTASKVNTTSSSYAFGAATGDASGVTGLRLTGSGRDGYSLVITGMQSGGLFGVGVSFNTTATVAQQFYLEGTFELGMDATGHLTLNTAATTATYNDGKPHRCEAEVHSILGTQTATIWVDGVQVLHTPAGGATGDDTGYLGGGNTVGRHGLVLAGPFANATFWNFYRWSALPTLARVQAHYGVSPGESTSARWARLLTYRPNPGGTTIGTAGTVGSGDITGQSLGDALADVATAEGGVIQSNRGVISLIGRTAQRDPATAVTLDASLGQVDLPTTWRDDTQALVNDVTVSRPNGASQRSVNTASTTGSDGVAQISITANVNSDRDAADMAGWLVAVGVLEQLDSPTLTINLYARANTALTMAVCALKTYDVVTLTNLPASAPASTMSFQVQGGTYTVGADVFTAELYTTTLPPKTLRADVTADAYTKLDSGLKIGW